MRGGDGKTKPGIHTGGIGAHRRFNKFAQLSKVNNTLKDRVHLSPVVTQQRAVQIHIFPPGKLGVKARAQLQQGSDLTIERHAPLGRAQHA